MSADIEAVVFTKILKIAFILIGVSLLAIILQLAARRLSRRVTEQRVKTVLNLLNGIITAGSIGLLILLILPEVGVNIAPLLASAGIVGIAVGFGSQELVKNIISGIFLLSEDKVRVGDRVKINNNYEGILERMGLTNITLRDINGDLHIIPNGNVSIISNQTRDWSQAVLEIALPSKYKVDEMIGLISETAKKLHAEKEMAKIILDKPIVDALEDLGGGKMVIRALIRTNTKSQKVVSRRFRYLLKKTFEEKGLEFG